MAPARRRGALVLAILLLAGPLKGCSAGRQLDAVDAGAAIVNGDDAAPGRFRYIASLRRGTPSGSHFCGGSLIHRRVVMTAAHCVRDLVTGLDRGSDERLPGVRLGGYFRASDAAGAYEARSTVATVVHPQFVAGLSAVTSNLLDNDVALLLLDSASSMPVLPLIGARVKAQWQNPVPEGTEATVIGWGKTNASLYTLPDQLQELAMKVLPLSVCQEQWGDVDWGSDAEPHVIHNTFANNSMLCAARDYPRITSGFCAGDSGGPLLLKSSGPAADLQIGVVSWGPSKCGQVNEAPYVYTNVSSVFNWVNETVHDLTGEWLGYSPEGAIAPAPTAASPVVLGFDGRQAQLGGAAGTSQQILSLPNSKGGLKWSLAGRLAAGPASGSTVLQSVTWKWGALVVGAAVNTRTRTLVVTSATTAGEQGKVVQPNTNQAVPNGALKYLEIRSGDARQVTLVQTGLTVTLTQPWSAAEGKWQPQLEVKVTLTQAPAAGVKLGGALGATLPTGVAAQSLKARIASIAASAAPK